PVVTGTLSTTVPYQPSGIKYMGVALNSSANLAAMAMGTSGVWLVNVANSPPTIVGQYDTPGTAYAVTIDSARNLMFVADGASGMQIIDITTPATPTLAGSISLGGTVVGVALSGNTACIANQDGTLYTVDVTNSHAPVFRGAGLRSGPGGLVAVDGTQAAVLSNAPSGDYPDIVDVSVPASPHRTGFVLVGPPGTAKGIDIVGGTAYVAANTQGVKIYDTGSTTPP